MSSNTIKAVQVELKTLDLYTGDIDGIAGTKTWDAIWQALKSDGPSIRQLLIRQQRQLNRIEKLVGSKRDAELDRSAKRLDKGTESLSKAVAASK